MDAAIELAAGRTASRQVGHRCRREGWTRAQGRSRGPDPRAQELLLLFADGELGSISESLAHLASQSDAPISTVAAYGLACAEAGDTEAALETAARLAAAPNLLVRAGASWPLVAMCASTISFAAGRAPRLPEACGGLWRTLSWHWAWPYTVGYCGTVDRCLGLLAITLG